MAKIRFLKTDEPSQKKDYIPASIKVHKYRKRWKRSFTISIMLNILFILYHFNIHKLIELWLKK